MEPWNPLSELVRQIGIHGGFVNSHAHFDRAYTIKPEMMDKTQEHLFTKWEYVDNFKRNARKIWLQLITFCYIDITN